MFTAPRPLLEELLQNVLQQDRKDSNTENKPIEEGKEEQRNQQIMLEIY